MYILSEQKVVTFQSCRHSPKQLDAHPSGVGGGVVVHVVGELLVSPAHGFAVAVEALVHSD